MKPYFKKNGLAIYNADCRDVLPGLEADLLVADPPYGIRAARRKTGRSKRDYGDLAWDDKPVCRDLLQQRATCASGGEHAPIAAGRQ